MFILLFIYLISMLILLCSQSCLTLVDARVPLFWFGKSNISDRDWCLGFPRASEEQCLLDTLLLAQVNLPDFHAFCFSLLLFIK